MTTTNRSSSSIRRRLVVAILTAGMILGTLMAFSPILRRSLADTAVNSAPAQSDETDPAFLYDCDNSHYLSKTAANSAQAQSDETDPALLHGCRFQ